jgi:UDP-N-acetylmuramate--alanine ligase
VTSSPGWADRRLHFVGIAGAGLSAYALAARALGASVTGSDASESPYLARVREAGIEPAIGHDAANVPDGAELVVSTAIPASNPEVAVARERGLPVLTRAEFLAQLTGEKRTIAVSGAHGKTTTTAMLAHTLLACGLDPAYLIGGTLSTTGTNAAWGDGDWLVVEADESDRSFLALDADVAVVTNVELDHHTTYGSRFALEDAFRTFLAGAPAAVLPEDDAPVRALRQRGQTPSSHAFQRGQTPLEREVVLFGPWEGPALAVPGEHNRRNASAALEAAVLAGADREHAAQALATFAGTGRRFEHVGTHRSGARIVDDYAHHPTEVAATVAAARDLAPRRLVAVFQPHLFSRTEHLAVEFGRALAGADVVALLDVYPARERQEDFPGVSGLLVAEHAADAAAGRRVLWLRDHATAERVLDPLLRDGDLVLVMGAGDVDRLGRALAAPPA